MIREEERAKAIIRTVVLYTAITFAAVVVLFPFVWMPITAFKVPGTEFDPESITEPLVYYQIKATGAVIR